MTPFETVWPGAGRYVLCKRSARAVFVARPGPGPCFSAAAYNNPVPLRPTSNRAGLPPRKGPA
jgi:hypothetical protein